MPVNFGTAAAANPSASQVSASIGMPAIVPSAFQTPTQTSSQRNGRRPPSGGPRNAARPAVQRPRDEDSDQEQEADHARLGERLHVEVLHAPRVLGEGKARGGEPGNFARAAGRYGEYTDSSSELSKPEPVTGWWRNSRHPM